MLGRKNISKLYLGLVLTEEADQTGSDILHLRIIASHTRVSIQDMSTLGTIDFVPFSTVRKVTLAALKVHSITPILKRGSDKSRI